MSRVNQHGRGCTRQVLYHQLAERIWSPDRLAQEAAA